MRLSLIHTAAAFVCLALGTATFGCSSGGGGNGSTGGEDGGGGGDGGGGTMKSFAADVYPIITQMGGPNCLLCHSPAGGTQAGLDLSGSAAMVYMRLVNQTPGTFPGACTTFPSGEKLVVPGNTDMSLLYNKIATTTPMCGSPMPLGLAPLSATQIATIKDWIDQGAAM